MTEEVDETKALATVFVAAAELLTGQQEPACRGEEARALLAALDYPPGDREAAADRAALLRAAARFARIFQLRAPEAPGLVFFGCEADPARIGSLPAEHAIAGLSGTGLSTREAFESCAGEAVEYLSQFVGAADPPLLRAAADRLPSPANRQTAEFISALLRHVGIDSSQAISWMPARRLADGACVHFPADMCIRRSPQTRDFLAPFKLSIGCGAGASFEGAALHGLYELIERDAVALWWRGGRRGGAIPPRSQAAEAAGDLLARLRQGRTARASWHLDITSDTGVPCVAALSSGPDGRGLACGFAARATFAAALRSATLEMCQMELGLAVIEAKGRESGEAAFNEADRLHLRRAALIDANACALLHPVANAITPVDEIDAGQELALQQIVDRLGRIGIEAFSLDLTRPTLGIPAARITAPGLQLEPSELVTERLAAAISETGGGRQHTRGVALF